MKTGTSRFLLSCRQGAENDMVAKKTKSINMTFPALYSYIINTNYRCMSGVLGLFISVFALVMLIFLWGRLTYTYRIMMILVALAFPVVNPCMLAFKAFRQLKLSPSYKKPLTYTFSDEGIYVEQGKLNQMLKWDMICRIMLTNQMLAIYTGRMHAFVIPLSELGDDRGTVLTSVVQFTSAYKPRISRNLKRFESGKGI